MKFYLKTDGMYFEDFCRVSDIAGKLKIPSSVRWEKTDMLGGVHCT